MGQNCGFGGGCEKPGCRAVFEELCVLRRFLRAVRLAYGSQAKNGDGPETLAHLAMIEVLNEEYRIRFGDNVPDGDE